jgi:hypothetical protein
MDGLGIFNVGIEFLLTFVNSKSIRSPSVRRDLSDGPDKHPLEWRGHGAAARGYLQTR